MSPSDAVPLAISPQQVSSIFKTCTHKKPPQKEMVKGNADSIPKLLYPKEHIPQTRMVRKQLHLARAVKQHVILPERPEPLLQPARAVVLQLLERVQGPAVGAQLLVRHDGLEGDQVADVERAGVGGAVVGRVEVHDGALAADGGEELLHAGAVGRFAGARGTDDQLGEGHGFLGGGRFFPCGDDEVVRYE